MKPGDIVKVSSKVKWRTPITLFAINSVEDLRSGEFPEKRSVLNGEIGFVVAEARKEEVMFDWLIEVAFPNLLIQGWVEKADLELVSPSEPLDHEHLR